VKENKFYRNDTLSKSNLSYKCEGEEKDKNDENGRNAESRDSC
jgi:hypothetical protein